MNPGTKFLHQILIVKAAEEKYLVLLLGVSVVFGNSI